MKGIDISHWQGVIDWSKVKTNFAFMKVTESTGFLDDKFKRNQEEARKNGILCGYYHFARGGDYKKEADWFLQNVGEIKKGELIALDYEIYTLADPADWCEKWLSYVESKVGFKPMLYTYHALLNKYDWRKVSDANFGLWAARYGRQEQEPNFDYQPATGSWNFYAIWQYTSKGSVSGISGNVDLNYTSMDIDTLKKYGAKENVNGGGQPAPEPDPYEENYKKILKYLGKAIGRDFGNNPSDGETKDIKEFLEDLDEIETMKIEITQKDAKIVGLNSLVELQKKTLEKVQKDLKVVIDNISL